MAKVELKQPIVEEIINNVKDAESVVLVNYSGLTVEQDTALRKDRGPGGGARRGGCPHRPAAPPRFPVSLIWAEDYTAGR